MTSTGLWSRRLTSKRTICWGAAAIGGLIVAAVSLPLIFYLRSFFEDPKRPSLRSAEGRHAMWRMIGAAADFSRQSAASSFDPPRLEIEIEPEAALALESQRAEALRIGVLFKSQESFVDAEIRYRGRRLTGRLRLKGDLPDHWAGRRKSFRIHLDRDYQIFGTARFSLQAPHTRRYHLEPIFFDILRARGILAPRRLFVDLTFNGRHLGLMSFEEHFTPQLLEWQGRPEGVILKLDEETFWRAWTQLKPLSPDFNNWRTVAIDGFGLGTIRRSKRLSTLYSKAAKQLRLATDGHLAPSEVFDAALWGRFLASCEVFGGHHMLIWHNLRFYFNPRSNRFEPIGFDSDLIPETDERSSAGTRLFVCQGGRMDFSDTLLADPLIRENFLRGLRELEGWVRSEEFSRSLSEWEAPYLQTLESELPWLEPFPLQAIRERAAELARINTTTYSQHVPARWRPVPDHPPDAAYPEVVRAAVGCNQSGTYLELTNVLSRPVRVVELVLSSSPNTDLPAPALPISLPPSLWGRIPERFNLPYAGLDQVLGSLVVEGVVAVEASDTLYRFDARPRIAPFCEPLDASHSPSPIG